MSVDIKLNADKLFHPHSGLKETELAFYSKQAQEAVHAVAAMESLGQFGFLHLDFLEDQVAAYRAALARISFEIRTHVVIGIGGSSLGARAILDALGDEVVASRARVKTIFLESTDPVAMARALRGVEWPQALVTVVSKSGTTLETLSLFLVVKERLGGLGKHWTQHVLAVTRQEGGALGEMARKEKFPLVAIPRSIGGRFSVLTAVGMIPALVAGLPAEAFFHGAKHLKGACVSTSWRENPALALALYQYLLHKKKGKVMTVLMPYAKALEGFSAWTAQLWAESIGKKLNAQGKEVREGFTPIRACGSVDEHSQCQLYLEGPRDKWVLFFEVEKTAPDDIIPACSDIPAERAWICGQSMHAILNAQKRATAQALYEQGVPSATVEIPALSAYTLGELFLLLELQTAYMGALYGVNAFDQPGVERIKVLTSPHNP